jgi:hypothetical protein
MWNIGNIKYLPRPKYIRKAMIKVFPELMKKKDRHD